MQSFRTEIENPVVEKDIIELANKIEEFQTGKIDEDKFRNLRLARGVYGQRQEGVQMIRIKIPYGRITPKQLRRIAAVSDEYSRGNLHFTTRQDIQIHYVSLDRTPELWSELEKDQITLREACGNTVRNVTATAFAGVDKNEVFDVTPYAHAFFEYFLRNPICGDMGRKFKVSFSGSQEDKAYSFIHDLGFIAKEKDGKRGFKVMLGGGIGSQPHHAHVAYEFLPEEEFIPFSEAVLRVFDHYGERARRNKARMKFLLANIGLEAFMELVEEQRVSLKNKTYKVDTSIHTTPEIAEVSQIPSVTIQDKEAFEKWKATNVYAQKQEGFNTIGIRVQTGDISSDTARSLADLIEKYAASDARITIEQGLMLRFVKDELLEFFYVELGKLGLNKAGFNGVMDIVTCPGTDTCNLGIASSMGLARELEGVLDEEYPQLAFNEKLKIKISGCMNSCGQHGLAHIGFQGMTIKSGKNIAPAAQILLGGSVLGDGQGRFADKVLKIPAKRAPQALRILLEDFLPKGIEDFIEYYEEKGEKYFYDMLTHLSDAENLAPSDFIDWGNEKEYEKAIGIGECASVIVDLVQVLIDEAKEAIEKAQATSEAGVYSDAIYHAYNAMVYAAKALLTTVPKVKMSSQATIVKLFDEHFVSTEKIQLGESFADIVYALKKTAPSQEFAQSYIAKADDVVKKISELRQEQLQEA